MIRGLGTIGVVRVICVRRRVRVKRLMSARIETKVTRVRRAIVVIIVIRARRVRR